MAIFSEQVARAWVNFNGQNTIAIRDSFNVSSITDNGTGDYTISFSTAMANTNYSVTGNNTYLMGTVPRYQTLSPYVWATGSIRVITGYNNMSAENPEAASVVVFGDV
tara:strand:+ start:528 stop:851 length:324 start_codon:yes stop_codon:yes gene_type:complete